MNFNNIRYIAIDNEFIMVLKFCYSFLSVSRNIYYKIAKQPCINNVYFDKMIFFVNISFINEYLSYIVCLIFLRINNHQKFPIINYI